MGMIARGKQFCRGIPTAGWRYWITPALVRGVGGGGCAGQLFCPPFYVLIIATHDSTYLYQLLNMLNLEAASHVLLYRHFARRFGFMCISKVDYQPLGILPKPMT